MYRLNNFIARRENRASPGSTARRDSTASLVKTEARAALEEMANAELGAPFRGASGLYDEASVNSKHGICHLVLAKPGFSSSTSLVGKIRQTLSKYLPFEFERACDAPLWPYVRHELPSFETALPARRLFRVSRVG